jgi:hypothetical protein
VVVPLKCARLDDPLGGIRAWARGQTAERGRFEVVVVSNGDHPEWEARLPELLTPWDRHLRPAERLGTFALMDLGAREARGRWVYLCELHTEPDPDCARALLAYLDAHDPAAAAANSGTTGRGRLARAEARHYQEVVGARLRRGESVLSPRGVAIRKDVLVKAGGVPADHGLFYEALLEAQLHDLGTRVGFAEAARFVHAEQTTLRGLCVDVGLWTVGEHRARARHDPAFCDRHFGRPDVWVERHAHRRDVAWGLARTAARASWAALAARRAGAFTGSAREALRATRRAAAGLWPELAGAGVSAAVAALRFALARDDRAAYPRYRELRRRLTQASRLWFAAREPGDERRPPAERAACSADDLGEDEMLGFHAIEHDARGPFRWTTPAAGLRVALAPGEWEVRIDTGGLRPDLRDASPVLGLNATPVPARDLRIEGGEIRFPIGRDAFVPGAEQRLWWACGPVRRARGDGEWRRLGLPFRSLRFEARP